MGALYGGTCYDSAAAAARAYFSEVAPVSSPGATTYRATVEEGPTDAWSLVTREGAVVVESQPLNYPAFMSCDPTQALLDGMQVGWLVVACWVSAWALVSLKRAFG